MTKTTATIEGMRCPMCEAHIQDTIRKLGGIKKVKASRHKKQATIISDREISQEELHSAIDPTGYTLKEIQSQPYEKKGFFASLFNS